MMLKQAASNFVEYSINKVDQITSYLFHKFIRYRLGYDEREMEEF